MCAVDGSVTYTHLQYLGSVCIFHSWRMLIYVFHEVVSVDGEGNVGHENLTRDPG